MPRLAPLAVVLSAVLAFAGEAHADAVPPAPDDCPEGAMGDTDHGGPHCRPSVCTTHSECKKQAGYRDKDKSFVCQPDVGLCIKTAGGGHGSKRPTAVDDCDDDSDCDDGATCVKASRCVEGELPRANDSGTDPSGGRAKSKCGCELTPSSSEASAWWLLALGALAWRRREI